MTDWILQNSLVAGGLAVVVTFVCLLNRSRPALCHLLWLLVFVTLVAPPLPIDSGPGTRLRQQMADWFHPPADEPSVESEAASSAPAAPLAAEPGSKATDTGWTAPVVGASPEQAGARRGMLASLAEVDAGTWWLLAWAAGSLLVALRQLRRILAFQRSLREAAPAPPELLHTVKTVARRLGVATPQVSVLSGIGTPSVWCFGPARLLWPAGETPRRARGEAAIIAHELAHIARKDHWVSRCEALAMVFLWWHPLAWIIRRQVHDASELSCDAWALWAYPTGRRAYAEALIDAQEKTAAAPIALHGLCATGRDIKDFERRLNMIMSHRPSHRVSRSAATVALLATLLVLPGFADDESVHESKAKPDAYGSVAGKVDAHKQGQRAEKLFAAGEREHALAAYREWLALDPDSGLAHARMGYLLIGMGELEEATGHLERQVELGHRPAVGTYNLACAAALSGDTATAEKALLRAVRLGFADAELLAKDGDLDAIRGSEGYEAAVALVDQANTLRKSLTTLMPWSDADDELALQVQLAQIVTGDGKLQHEVGYALISAGQLEPAATAFERQAAAGYKPANALYNTACVRARMGDTEGAFAALEESARLGMHYADIVDDTDLDSLRGDSRFEALSRKIGASDEPSSAFKQALKEGDAEKAVAILDAITAEQLDTPATKELASWGPYELGSMALAQEQPERALQCFHRALEAGYAADQTVFQMAKAYARIGEQELALQHLDDALTLGYAEPRDVQELVEASTFCDAETGARLVAWAEKIAAKKKKKQEAWAREEEEYARTAEKEHGMEDGGTR